MDEAWRLIHLVAAAFWLGGMISLAIIAVIAARTLERPTFRRFMARAGRSFAVASVIARATIAADLEAILGPPCRNFGGGRLRQHGHDLLWAALRPYLCTSGDAPSLAGGL